MYTLLEAVNAEHFEELRERIEAYEALVIADEKVLKVITLMRLINFS